MKALALLLERVEHVVHGLQCQDVVIPRHAIQGTRFCGARSSWSSWRASGS